MRRVACEREMFSRLLCFRLFTVHLHKMLELAHCIQETWQLGCSQIHKTCDTFQAQVTMQMLLVRAGSYLHSCACHIFTRCYGHVGATNFQNGDGHWSGFVVSVFGAVVCASTIVIPPSTVYRMSGALVHLQSSGKGNYRNMGKRCPSRPPR